MKSWSELLDLVVTILRDLCSSHVSIASHLHAPTESRKQKSTQTQNLNLDVTIVLTLGLNPFTESFIFTNMSFLGEFNIEVLRPSLETKKSEASNSIDGLQKGIT